MCDEILTEGVGSLEGSAGCAFVRSLSTPLGVRAECWIGIGIARSKRCDGRSVEAHHLLTS